MLARQKQLIESYRRVQDFLANHPPPESPGYLEQKKTLDAVVATLNDHAINQVAGRRLTRGEVTRQRALQKALREEHLRPIAKIARATLADAPGIERALNMPGYHLGPLKLVAEANAMRTAAAQYEPHFVAAGRPADFLAQLDAAAEAVLQSMLGKARSLGRQVGAGAGIDNEIRRGRRTVEVIDTIIQAAFRGDQNVLAKWRNARRVQALPGAPSAASGGSVGSDAAPVVTPVISAA